ncbi:MAG: cation diffusion facilitator family transporter [Candidatus Bathyarchaeia archaeon]
MRSYEKGNYKIETLKLSITAVTSVVLVEVSLGLIVNSLAILSDGLHALLDALTTFVLFVATRVSLKPPDEEHMYGHEKFESIGGLIGGIALIGVAAFVMFEAVVKIIEGGYINRELEFVGFIAIGYTLCIDFIRVGTFMKAIRSESSTMKAGLYHAVSDLSSTIIALFGFGLAAIGFYYGDSIASIVLSVLLAYLSIRLAWSSGMELSDIVSREVVRKVKTEITSQKDVLGYENLKVRKSGEKIFIRATLKVPDYISLEEAHEISAKIESGIKSTFGNAEIAFHIEPIGMKEMPTKKLVERLAAEVEGVQEVHEIRLTYTKARLYITLHALVDPKISIKEAHEIAEEIENKIRKNIENVENITVHIEPFISGFKKAYTIDENDIRKIVQKVADRYGQSVRIRNMLTYVADEKRYVNIDCVFGEEISIKDAHKIASQTEEEIKKQFEETTVTVHMEPSSSS